MKWTNKGHEYDSIGRVLENKKHLYLYGVAANGYMFYNIIKPLLERLNWDITFLDGDSAKRASGFMGNRVYSPSILKTINKDDSFVVVAASSNYLLELMDKCKKYGFEEKKNLFDFYFFFSTMLSVHFLYVLNTVYISSLNIVPSTICNLNCFACLNFNPFITKHTTYELSSLTDSVDALFNKIDLISRFQITGGDPLLYPKVVDLIEYIGSRYRNKIIEFEIVTNGTLIPSDELCLAMEKYDMLVIVDDYRCKTPIADKNYPLIIEKLENYDLRILENRVERWFNIIYNIERPKTFTKKQAIQYRTKCDIVYATLVENKITSCNYAHYAEKAGMCEHDEDNYFSLTDCSSKEELIEFRTGYSNSGYTSFCRSCDSYRDNKYWLDSAIQMPKSFKYIKGQ
jgi:hypothetical protein